MTPTSYQISPGQVFDINFTECLRAKLPKSVEKVAILASSEYEGIFKNGGIGTYYATLSRKLADEGWYNILLLFQTDVEFGGESHIPALKHIFSTHELNQILDIQPIHRFLLSTLEEWDWVQRDGFNAMFFTQAIATHFSPKTKIYVEFAEMCGLGHYTVQAKQSGILPSNCVTAITMHSGHEWIYEAHGKYIIDAPEWFALAKQYEQLSFENADLAFFLSHFLKEKVEGYGWKTDHALYLPYCFPIMEELLEQSKDVEIPDVKIDAERIPIIFFGRLEERKGLVTFIQALHLLPIEIREKLHILFLGKVVQLYSHNLKKHDSQSYIEEKLSGHFKYEIMNGLFSQQAIKLISTLAHPIVCLTSPEENFPNSSLEMGQLPVSVIASDTGGFRETMGLVNRSECLRWFIPKDSHSLSHQIKSTIEAYPETPTVPEKNHLAQINHQLLEKRINYMEACFKNE